LLYGDWGSLLAPPQHSLQLQQLVAVAVAVVVEVVAAVVVVVVPHLVCLWWSEWTVTDGVLHCAPMCQQNTCNSNNKPNTKLINCN
jgi:hypothetical protein